MELYDNYYLPTGILETIQENRSNVNLALGLEVQWIGRFNVEQKSSVSNSISGRIFSLNIIYILSATKNKPS